MSKTGFKKGRLGIGTENPKYPLDVVGDIRLTGGFRDASGNDFNFLAINNTEILKTADIAGITCTDNKVGIFNAIPTEVLDINGNTKITGDLNFTGTLKQNGVAFGGGKFEDAATSGDIYYNGGNVGIGITGPLDQLHVYKAGTDQAWKGRGIFGNETCAFVCGVYHNKVHLGGHNGALNAWYDITINPGGGNVGIGTTDPGIHRLHVKGTTSAPMYGQALKVSTNGACWLELEANAGGSSEEWGICSAGDGDLDFYKRTGTGGVGYKMTLTGNGNLGIGTTTAGARLHVKGAGAVMKLESTNTTGRCWYEFYDAGSTTRRWYMGMGSSSNRNMYIYSESPYYNLNLNHGGGRVGIGTTSPEGGLHVANYYDHGSGQVGTYFLNQNSYAHASSSWMHNSNSNGRIYVGIRCNYGIWCSQLNYDSDSRIKTEITDLSDNRALELLRNIPCREYHYKDIKKREKDKTIGFIAQEVNEILPNAVSIQPNIIPNEMRMLKNTLWEEIIDGSNNTYKLTTDLQDVSGIKYRFYVSNDPSGNDEEMKEVIGNADNSFTFDKQWNNVFCYGKEVDDFHTLDKQKLFALNFSATQELDKKVIVLENENEALKGEVQELKGEVQELKTIVNALKNHLGLA